MSSVDETRKNPRDGAWPRWTPRVREVEKQALDDYIGEVVEEACTDYHSMFGVLSQYCESPIEALFLAAFLPHALRDPGYKIVPQASLGDYRADFLVTFTVETASRSVVVECDGHDFHEKTKEQAERDKRRDRFIASQGYPVLRFTGRELHRDSAECVQEVMDFTQTTLLDDMNEELRRGRS